MIRRAFLFLLSRFEAEVIGQEECPLMVRWTIADLKFTKLLVHYFPPNVSDRDPHDHPRSFVTLVLHGRYFDTSWEDYGGERVPTIECVETGAVRYRSATHLHIVETDDLGCWTIVVMGPLVREWGFMRLGTGRWWPWGKYIQRFGGVIRCDAPPDTMGVEPEAGDPDHRHHKRTEPPG